MQLAQTTAAFAIAAALAAPAVFAETTSGDANKPALKPASNWEGSLILEGIYFDRSFGSHGAHGF